MTFEWKQYNMGFKVGPGILNKKYKILNRDRYVGRGRPKVSDYDYKTLQDLQREYNDHMNNLLDSTFLFNAP